MEKEEPETVVTVKDKVCVLRFNRPRKKNAITSHQYEKIVETLDKVAADPDISIMVVTGTGEYFTSGNEFTLQSKILKEPMNDHERDGNSSEDSIEVRGKKSSNIFQRFVSKLIDFPKPLIAVVNGPAIGIGVTILPHFDVIFASDKATFSTPFITLALVPEGCSSYTFPRIMGPGMAAKMLMMGEKITAAEAYQHNFVTEVIPAENLDQVWPKIYNWAQLPPNTMVVIKSMITAHKKEFLHKVNAMECTILRGRFKEDEFFVAMMKFFSRKSKL